MLVFMYKTVCVFLCFLFSVCACVCMCTRLHVHAYTAGSAAAGVGGAGSIYSVFFLDLCCDLSVCVTPAKKYLCVENLMPRMMVLGGAPLGSG